MFDLYNLIASGYTPEELAKTFTAQLNEAENRIKEEEEAARAEQERKAQEAAKRDDFQSLAHNMLLTISRHYPDVLSEEDITDDTVNLIAELFTALLDMEGPKTRKLAKAKTAVDPFAAFFKQFGL